MDKLIKVTNNELGTLTATLLVDEVASTQLTPTPAQAPGIIVIRPGTEYEEHIYYETRDAGAGTITTLTRDIDNRNGGVGREHPNGSPWETMMLAEYFNGLVDAVLVGHNKNGKHLISNIDSIKFAVDAGGDDDYEITLDPIPTSYHGGMEINFIPATANTGACTLNVNELGAKTIKKNVSDDLADGDIAVGKLVKVIYDGTNFQLISNALQEEVETEMVEGALLNGKIVPSVDSFNLTVALKTLSGDDPSADDVVKVMINGSIREISEALSVTLGSGTNWFNAGSTELANNEIDYFVYLGYNATDGVVLGASRVSEARQYSDFNVTNTDEKYCVISTITTASATDYYHVIGRFSATNSGTASWNWSVPTFTAINLIQRPIYDNRVTTPSMPSPQTRLNSKIIIATRNFTAGAGDVSYTGVGFRPSSLDLIGCVAAGSFPQIWGFADSQKTNFCLDRAFDSNFRTRANYLVYTSPSPGTEIHAVVKSYDADGFTLTWTKGGAPTGTFEFAVKCSR